MIDDFTDNYYYKDTYLNFHGGFPDLKIGQNPIVI